MFWFKCVVRAPWTLDIYNPLYLTTHHHLSMRCSFGISTDIMRKCSYMSLAVPIRVIPYWSAKLYVQMCGNNYMFDYDTFQLLENESTIIVIWCSIVIKFLRNLSSSLQNTFKKCHLLEKSSQIIQYVIEYIMVVGMETDYVGYRVSRKYSIP